MIWTELKLLVIGENVGLCLYIAAPFFFVHHVPIKKVSAVFWNKRRFSLQGKRESDADCKGGGYNRTSSLALWLAEFYLYWQPLVVVMLRKCVL